MSDPAENLIDNVGVGPEVTGYIDADPQKAARSLQLAQATGVPAAVVDADVDSFELQTKARMASAIASKNGYIRDYIRNNPLAAKVSNDDYGKLDFISGMLRDNAITRGLKVLRAADIGSIEGFKEGVGDGHIGSWISTDDWAQYPFLSSIASTIGAPLELGFRGLSGAVKGTAEAVRGAGTEIGGPQFGRDMAGIIEMLSNPGHGAEVPHLAEGAARARPWLEAGEEPPAGLHPAIDKIKLDANTKGLETVDTLISEAQSSTTRERAPELFQNFIRQHVEDTQIGLAGPRVLEIYGDRIPDPNDGMLGWVPDIDSQLAVARETGADIKVPLADWITRVDPAIAKELHDDTRVVRGGITKREAVESAAIPPIPVVDSPLALMRANAALEPLFSIGDRKLQLQRMAAEKDTGQFGPAQGFHDFDMLNENGQSVGTINLSEQKGGKELYIEMINGIGEYYNPNNFGPSLMRDLLRQIKAEFPNAEVLTGHRVTGAREAVGSISGQSAMPRIKLDDPGSWDRDIPRFSELAGGAWYKVFDGFEAYQKPGELWKAHEVEVADALAKELNRLAPGIDLAVVSEFRRTEGGSAPTGMMIPYKRQAPLVAVALNAPDSMGTLRHEAIHVLRQYKFLNDAEWDILTKASKAEGWQDKYRIGERYTGKSEELRTEESIADAYKHWEAEREARAGQPQTAVDKIFEKIKAFFDAIRERLSKIFGREVTADEVFERISSGEVGQRGPGGVIDPTYRESKTGYERELEEFRKKNNLPESTTEQTISNIRTRIGQIERDRRANKVEGEKYPPNGELFELRNRLRELTQEPKFSIDEPGLTDINSPFAKAQAVGMTVEQHKRYIDLIRKRQQDDLKASVSRVLKEQTKRQSAEWKAESEKLRSTVVADLNARPDIAVDKFLGLGELFGEKLDRTYKLDWESLNAEQRKALPEKYMVRKGGVDPQQVADMFGYPNPDAMISAIAGLEAARKESGLGRDRFMRQMVDNEIQRRMEREHGLLEKNIFDEARDQIASENDLDILHEETHSLALMSGEQGFNLSREQLATEMRSRFDNLKVGQIDSEHFLKNAGKFGKAAEMELLRGNPTEAFKAKQAQYYNMTYANFSKALEKNQERLAKTARPFQRGRTSAVDPQFTDHIQKLLGDAGFKIKRDAEELQHSIEFHGANNLTKFVDHINSLGWEPEVADWLQANGAKPIEQMTASEFSDFKDAIDSLNHIGRQIHKIEVAGERQDFNEFKAKVIDNITQLPERSRASLEGDHPIRRAIRFVYGIDASLTKMEEMIKDLDLRKELGPLWDAVIHPMVLSKTKEFDLMTDLSKYFQEVRGKFGKEWRKSLDDSIPQDLIHDPKSRDLKTGETSPYDMSRTNLIQIMLNWGTKSNIDKFVQGAGFARWGRRLSKDEASAYQQAIENLIHTHARKEDWDFVQAMWEPFKGWQKEMDTVARNTTGVAPKWIPPQAIQTPHGVYEGGYWPVKYDKLSGNIEVVKERGQSGTDKLFGTDYFRAATAKGYLKTRTGYVDFVDINRSIEQAAATMQQTIHDIAFRDALIQGAKVFYDPQIRAAIRNHYGVEYEKQLIPWLKRISYQFSADDPALQSWNDFLRRTRMNLVGHTLPLNLKVFLSPSVGMANPVSWARYIANKAEYNQIAETHSAEIKHLVYNLDRDYREALNRVTTNIGAGELQRQALNFGWDLTTFPEQTFRKITFVEKFQEAKLDGKTDPEAALLADSFVRERHGAASIVDLPAAMSSNEGMKMLTLFYGYFNTMYNWQRQIPGQLRRGELSEAAKTAWGAVIVGAAFNVALFNQQKENDSWFKTIAKGVVSQPLSTVPVLGAATNYFFEGFAPNAPYVALLKAASSIISDAKKISKGQKVEKPITHAANVVGLATGLPLAQIGRTAQFTSDAMTGAQRPRNIGEWARGIITGEARLKK